MVDMAESDSANTIICGSGRLVRRIFLTKGSFRIPAGNHGFFLPLSKNPKNFSYLQKKKTGFTGFLFHKCYSSSFMSPSFTQPSLRIKKSNKRDNTAGRMKQTRIRPTQLSTVTSYG